MTKRLWIGLIALVLGFAMSPRATSADCCAPGSACCGSGCCN